MAILTISTDADDCYAGSDGSFNKTAEVIYIGNASAGDVPLRACIPIKNVTLPNAFLINSATLEVYAAASESTTTVKIIVGCEAADNPPSPTTKNDLFGRTMTTAKLTNNNVEAWTAGTKYTFDITTSVQEVLNRAGWASGNQMNVLIFDNAGTADKVRTIASYENVTYTTEPKLLIETLGGGFMMFSS